MDAHQARSKAGIHLIEQGKRLACILVGSSIVFPVPTSACEADVDDGVLGWVAVGTGVFAARRLGVWYTVLF